jgi:hypothetical protein
MKVKTFGPGLTPDKKCWLGIDQSYSGFAMTFLAEDGSYITSVKRFEDTGVRRLALVYVSTTETLKAVEEAGNLIKDTCMEGYAYGSQMANMAGELGAIVKMSLYSYFDNRPGQYPLIVPPTNLKKYVAGKGNAVSKSQMLLNVYKKWNVEFNDDNAADSYGLAHIVSGSHTREAEKEVFEKLQDPKFREK